ncbi:hypothetical protein MSPP1_002927 [Malassezia sp. CBS 17886]|nr:hypothetical protein MSPP1_002927 [Malassezia sp. CBS 17886]
MFFLSTFVVALVTVSVSASTILPCPASGTGPLGSRLGAHSRSALAEAAEKTEPTGVDREALPGGWIEITEQPSWLSLRRWTS